MYALGVHHQAVPHWQRRFCRIMRRDQTDAEGLLWWAIRSRELSVRFRRQHPVGPYIVDFVCLSERLIVEVDGEHHTEADDGARDRDLRRRGFRVLRFWNGDVFLELDLVLDEIVRAIEGSA